MCFDSIDQIGFQLIIVHSKPSASTVVGLAGPDHSMGRLYRNVPNLSVSLLGSIDNPIVNWGNLSSHVVANSVVSDVMSTIVSSAGGGDGQNSKGSKDQLEAHEDPSAPKMMLFPGWYLRSKPWSGDFRDGKWSDQEAISELLRVERDSELEYTQEELNAVPTPDESSEISKPIEFLVSHGKAPQELCDTICNLNAVSTSIGLGGMHLVIFRVEGNHRLPPTTLSPGDMVCVRICDRRGASATSCMQGFVNNLGEDGCSISIALESRHGDPTFSKLFGKFVRIDRIPRLADTLTYERNCEALMLLRKNGLLKKNPSINIVATLFGDQEDVSYLQENPLVDWDEAELDGKSESGNFDDSQRKEMQNMRNCYDSLLSAVAATTNIAYGSGYAVVTHRDPLLMATWTMYLYSTLTEDHEIPRCSRCDVFRRR
ncbi:hypothetical protein ACFE04_022026 [Oxalis oulophora]